MAKPPENSTLIAASRRTVRRWKSFYTAYQYVPNRTLLHEMRLEFKALIALTKTMEEMGSNKALRKLQTRLDLIFQLAGDVRELEQICRQLGRWGFLKTTFYAHAKARWKTKKWKLLHSLEKNERSLFKKIDHLPETAGDIPMKYIEAHVLGIYQLLKDQLKDPYLRNNLHHVRKQTKYILHARTWLHDETPALPNVLMVAFLQDIDQLIGNWHDMEVMNKYLASIRKKRRNKAWAKAYDLCNAQKTDYLSKVNNRLEEMV